MSIEKTRANLNELVQLGLATTTEEIENVLAQATRGNNFYIGTDVKAWLSSFEAVTIDTMIEYFSHLDDYDEIIEGSHLEFGFTEISHHNSYNWCGNSNTDIDFKILQGDNENIYMYVRIHVGQDIRAGYTEGILLDLETYNADCFYLLFEEINEFSNSGYVEIEGIRYSVDGDITSEGLRVYNYESGEEFEVYDSIYEFDKEGFNNAILELVTEAINNQ